MKLDVGLMTFVLPTVAAYARRAEELGFGAIWSAETRHDPFLPLAVASTTTSRMGLGTAIAFARSPMIHAPTTSAASRWPGSRPARGCGRSSRPCGPSGSPGRTTRRFTSRADFTLRASTMVVLGDTEEERRGKARAVKQQIAFYAVLAVDGLEDLVPRLHAKQL